MLGGNGYVEESGLPRLYRQAPLNSIWEGSGNVIALDVLRAMGRSSDTLAAVTAEIELARGRRQPVRRRRQAAARRARRPRRSCPSGRAGSPACWRCACRARCCCGTRRRRSPTPSAPPAWAGTGAPCSARCRPARRRRDRRTGFGRGCLIASGTDYSSVWFAGGPALTTDGPRRTVARTAGRRPGGRRAGSVRRRRRRVRPGRPDLLARRSGRRLPPRPRLAVHLPERGRRGAAGRSRRRTCSAGSFAGLLPRRCAARSSSEAFAGVLRDGPAPRSSSTCTSRRTTGSRSAPSRTPRGLAVFVRDVDEHACATDRQRDDEMRRAHRRPGGAAVGDRAGRRGRPHPDRPTGPGTPTASCCAARRPSRAASATTTWTPCRAGLRPADHAAIVAGIDRLQAEPVDGPAGTFDHEYSARLGARDRWFRLQAARVEASPRVVVTHTDVTERVRGEQALAWQAGHDELTGLPNRATLLELTGAALGRRRAERGRRPRCWCSTSTASRPSTTPSATRSATRCCARWARGCAEQVRPGRRRRPARRRPVRRPRPRRATPRRPPRWPSGCRRRSACRSPPSGISVPLSASIGVAVSRPEDARRRTSCSATPTPRCSRRRAPAATGCTCSRPALREAARWRLEVATRLRERRDRPARRPLPAGRAAGHRRGRGRRGAGPLAAPRAGPPAPGRLPRPSPRRPGRSSRSPAGCCARRRARRPSGPRRGCRCGCRSTSAPGTSRPRPSSATCGWRCATPACRPTSWCSS